MGRLETRPYKTSGTFVAVGILSEKTRLLLFR